MDLEVATNQVTFAMNLEVATKQVISQGSRDSRHFNRTLISGWGHALCLVLFPGGIDENVASLCKRDQHARRLMIDRKVRAKQKEKLS